MIVLPQSAQTIIDTLTTAGFEAYAVGGSVRDLLLGFETKGWDFTTSAVPEDILKLFPDSFYDNQFGTVGIKMPDDIFEITTYRSEEGYKDHRHPDKIIWGKTILEDLSRRDFTINAIASDGKILIDPYEGRKDLEKKLIRTVGGANQRFAEDALRMMRAVRFTARFGFSIESKTAQAISDNAASIPEISAERVRDEFFKILSAKHASDAVLVLKNLGLLHFILPELEIAFATPQKSPKRHHVYDVGTHSVLALKNCPSSDPIVRLATLIHDLGKPKTYRTLPDGVITFYNHEVVGTKIARDVAKRMRVSNKQYNLLTTLVRWHQFSVDERQTDAALRRFIKRVGKENLEHILALRIGDRLGGGATETSWRLELYKKRLEEVQKQPFTVADLQVNGYDVMKLFAVKPGPIIGEVLDKLFAEVEAGTLPNEREVLLKRLSEISVFPTDPKEAKQVLQ